MTCISVQLNFFSNSLEVIFSHLTQTVSPPILHLHPVWFLRLTLAALLCGWGVSAVRLKDGVLRLYCHPYFSRQVSHPCVWKGFALWSLSACALWSRPAFTRLFTCVSSEGRAFEDLCQQVLPRVCLVPGLLPAWRSHLWSKCEFLCSSNCCKKH